MELTLSIPGRPIPKQSYRHSARGGWQPKRVTDFKKLTAQIAAIAVKHQGWSVPDESVPLAIQMHFCFQRPKNARKSERDRTSLRVITPDIDNLSKAVLDGLRFLWSDDRQVAVLLVAKLDVPRGGECVKVKVKTLEKEHEQNTGMDLADPEYDPFGQAGSE